MSAKTAASLVAAAALLAGPGAAGAAVPASIDPAPDAEFVPGQLLVRFDPGVGKAESAELAGGQGAEVIERYGIVPRLALVDLPASLGVEAAERRFERLGDVSFAQPNRIYRTALDPDDEFIATAPNALWGLHNTGQQVPSSNPVLAPLVNPPFTPDALVTATPDSDIDAPEAWNTETGEAAVKVGVIDSGLTVAHEDIVPNLWINPLDPVGGGDDDLNGLVDDVNGWDFVEGDNTPDDASGHGTHVAGAVGAQGDNLVGTAGAAWDVSLVGLKAGSADGRLYASAILNAIEYADEQDIPIVNGSFTGGGDDGPGDVMRIAYENAGETLFVVAAGNSAVDVDGGTEAFPCEFSLPNILCVAATTPTDGLASFSNVGASNVDLAAPGTNALSTEPAFATPVFSDDFEDGSLTEWVVDGTPAASWSNSPDPEGPNLGGFGLTDSPGGNYVNSENSWIRMANPVSLTGKQSCRLSVASGFTLASGDSLQVEYTTDLAPGPSSTWLPLYPGGPVGTPYTGNGVFSFRNLDMDMMGATGQPNVTVRFRLVSDAAGTVADGVHIDNVKIECVDTSPSGSLGAYRVRQGTSMASPAVAGVAALVLSNDPGQDLSVSELRNTLLASVDPLVSLKCKAATGGRVNAATALALNPATAIPPPPPNCSSQGSTVPQPVVTTPIEDGVVVKKCKKPKKGATAKAKSKFKKCKKKLAKG